MTPSSTPSAESSQAKPPLFKFPSSLAPIPTKLVKCIQALEYVDMHELLPDNIALAEQLTKLPSNTGHTRPPEQWEVGSLMTWVSPFATYVAIVTQAHPHCVMDMLAYMRLIIREAIRFGGNGWLTHDMVFWCNMEGSANLWNIIDPSLHVAYIHSGPEGDGSSSLCHMPGGTPSTSVTW